MPGAVHGEKLYGPPGPTNNAVLMDIISKLKRELQESRAENGKLVDQLNVLIALIKRAWGGEQAASIHLANIVGVPAPSFSGSELLRNTPVPDRTKAVKNWERMATRLLERAYAAIQKEIKERQKIYMERRQMYMDSVIEDHQDEMARFNLHRQKGGTSVQEVDKKFLRCYSAKAGGSRQKSSGSRPKSAYSSKPRSASDMVEKAEMSVTDLIGQNGAQNQQPSQLHVNTNAAFSGLYRMSSVDNDRRPPRRRHEQFDDPNRYKQSHLFDPDVIFGAQIMPEQQGIRSRPSSASSKQSQSAAALKTRPKSAVFKTEVPLERPLKYETTRPVSGKPKSTASTWDRIRSAPSRRTNAPATFSKKEIHNKDDETVNRQEDLRLNFETDDLSGHVTADSQEDEVLTNEKPPVSVKVKKGHPMDAFMNELRMAEEMQQDFKKSAIALQRRLGIETDGIVY